MAEPYPPQGVDVNQARHRFAHFREEVSVPCVPEQWFFVSYQELVHLNIVPGDERRYAENVGSDFRDRCHLMIPFNIIGARERMSGAARLVFIGEAARAVDGTRFAAIAGKAPLVIPQFCPLTTP